MINKSFLNTDITWRFPIYQYTIDVSYYETRRASGISYIILELIDKFNNNEKINQTLQSLGIPADISYIFCDEFSNMYHYNIIKMKNDRRFYPEYWDEYHFIDFEITEHGKELIKNGEIPTGDINKRELRVYYDYVMKNTESKWTTSLDELDEDEKKQSIEDSKTILNNSDIEKFISKNMASYNFKKKEVISKYKHSPVECFSYELKKEVAINIDKEKLSLIVKNKMRDLYIKANYSVDNLSKIIAKEKQYRFCDNDVSENLKDYEYSDVKNIVKVNSPSEWNQLMETKNQLSMSLGMSMKKSEYSIEPKITEEIFKKYNIDAYSCYYENNSLYSILPGSFFINVDGFNGKCKINLIITEKLTENLSKEILEFLFLKSLEDMEPLRQCKIVKKISDISQKKEYIEEFAVKNIEKQERIEDKIAILIELNEEFKSSKFWRNIVIQKATELFEKICLEVTLKNITEKDELAQKLNKILSYNELTYLEKISKTLNESETKKIEIYKALEKLDYGIENILVIANVFEIFISKILKGEVISPQTELAKECILLENVFKKLKKITGIKNTLEDSVRLNMNNEEFTKEFSTFSNSIKKLEKYKKFAIDEFDNLFSFYKRYTEIKEFIEIEKNALKNPKKINKSYIANLLKNSKFKDAVCDLHIRLEFELRKLFPKQAKKTVELIAELKKRKYLTEGEINSLNILRKCRNNFQHPENKRKVNYSEKEIKKWCDIIEKLGRIDSESCKSN